MFSKPSNDTIRYARGKLTDYQCIYRVNIDGSIGSEKSDSDKNKIDWNKKYTTISVYAFLVICASIIFFSIMIMVKNSHQKCY